MARHDVAPQALADPKAYYDSRFQRGYMQGFEDLIESCRLRTVEEMLASIRASGRPMQSVLDYGCGEGRYLGVVRKFFPEAVVVGSDISRVGLQIAASRFPDATYVEMMDESVKLPDASFDLIMCIEVLEHVRDVARAVGEIDRLLRPGGTVLVSTPCANVGSLEWFYNRLTGGIQRAVDGYPRFATDEPGHVRRLRSRDLTGLLRGEGLATGAVRFRAHLFTTLLEGVGFLRRLPLGMARNLAMLDWRLFKRLPNGATMVVLAEKPGSTTP